MRSRVWALKLGADWLGGLGSLNEEVGLYLVTSSFPCIYIRIDRLQSTKCKCNTGERLSEFKLQVVVGASNCITGDPA
ncbi:hypothetical protein ACTXT7_017005 [Hymenolepis weldensis]